MAALLDHVILPASAGLTFVDAATGQPVLDGLQCTLMRRRDGKAIASAHATPSGVHHWPELDERWRSSDTSVPAQADVLVRDEFERFLPLSLAWPLADAVGTTLMGAVRLARISLLSAPARPSPPGYASVFAHLIWQATAAPAAWARVTLTNAQGQVVPGSCNDQGLLSVHLPLGRPQRDAGTGATFAVVDLKVFFDPALALAASPLGAPDALAWATQTEVRALARADQTTALDSLRLEVGRAAVPITQGLVPRRSELRLVSV